MAGVPRTLIRPYAKGYRFGQELQTAVSINHGFGLCKVLLSVVFRNRSIRYLRLALPADIPFPLIQAKDAGIAPDFSGFHAR